MLGLSGLGAVGIGGLGEVGSDKVRTTCDWSTAPNQVVPGMGNALREVMNTPVVAIQKIAGDAAAEEAANWINKRIYSPLLLKSGLYDAKKWFDPAAARRSAISYLGERPDA
jgi:hypothetical protein